LDSVAANVNVVLVMLSASIGSLKVALTVLLVHTPMAAIAGLLPATVGGIRSAVAAVVHFQT
jgi:hypothetical protein